ncbi:MAG: DUF429 domain-containing protein [Leptospiraceae bacterium]|nr:DUF429 domain-containing protein [Leptospiraceae bacterium]
MATRNKLYIGIDVGAERKGYHAAILDTQGNIIQDILHFQNPDQLAVQVQRIAKMRQARIAVVAIDAPPKSWINARQTRAAEQAVRRAGFRVQWTPRNAGQSPQWMQNGERLWDALRAQLPASTRLIEGFPTAASEALYHSDIQLPLHILAGKQHRKYYPDLIDAAILAQLARDHDAKHSVALGPDDPLGPIYLPKQQTKVCTLVLVEREVAPAGVLSGRQILLGLKKCGFGAGFWNGFGGKLEAGDKSLAAGAARELLEESHLEAQELTPRGRLTFTFAGSDELLIGHVFGCRLFQGSARESDEMRPRWFAIEKIPYNKMWPDDIFWLPWFLDGYNFEAAFHFGPNDQVLSQAVQIYL